MGNEAPGGDSSSPNADRVLVEVRPQRGPAGTGAERRLRLALRDGSCFFVTRQMLSELGLAELLDARQAGPVALEEAALRALRRQAALLAAREKAVALLSRSPVTEKSLRQKLRERGHSPEAIEEAAAWLGGRGLLDDRRFAEAWLAARLERHPEGRGALIAGLRRRGVPREVAEEAVARLVDAQVEREAAERLLAKLRRRGAADPQELGRRLSAKGFRRPLVRSLLEGDS